MRNIIKDQLRTVSQTIGHSLLRYKPKQSDSKRGLTTEKGGGRGTKQAPPSEAAAPIFANAFGHKLASLKQWDTLTWGV